MHNAQPWPGEAPSGWQHQLGQRGIYRTNLAAAWGSSISQALSRKSRPERESRSLPASSPDSSPRPPSAQAARARCAAARWRTGVASRLLRALLL